MSYLQLNDDDEQPPSMIAEFEAMKRRMLRMRLNPSLSKKLQEMNVDEMLVQGQFKE
jgi:hypothetical protein